MDHTPIPPELFTTILRSVPICTVDVLFFNKKMDKIVLFKRNNDPLRDVYFSMGGRLLKNETMLDCAKRQIRREVGINPVEVDLEMGGVQEEIHDSSAFDNATYHAIAIFYYCVVDEDGFQPTLDTQHEDSKWFPINDEGIHPLIRSRIDKIIKNYEKGL